LPLVARVAARVDGDAAADFYTDQHADRDRHRHADPDDDANTRAHRDGEHNSGGCALPDGENVVPIPCRPSRAFPYMTCITQTTVSTESIPSAGS
jgi:hypothetical protein